MDFSYKTFLSTYKPAEDAEVEITTEDLMYKPLKQKTSMGVPNEQEEDVVNHPSHYARSHPGKIECIEVTQHMSFCLGNAVKYIWRQAFVQKKGDKYVEDLEKAVWYLRQAISMHQGGYR